MNYCFTLAYNLPSEVEKVTKLLYEQNDRGDFAHLIVDLGFPISEAGVLPTHIGESKVINSKKLLEISRKYKSGYIQMPNIGVSQNWTQVFKFIKPSDDDVLIGCDPDEHPQNKNWVKAVGDVIREGDFALCSLMMIDHIPIIANFPHQEKFIGNNRVCLLPNGSLNWALVGLSGKFLNNIGEVPVPQGAERYGWIEGALYPFIEASGLGWCVLPDYTVKHTDFEWGDPGTDPILRQWKNQIIFNIHQYGQLSLDDFIKMKLEGKI